MSTTLCVIFKSGITGKTNLELAQYVLPKLKALNIKPSLKLDGTFDDTNWEIQVDELYEDEDNFKLTRIQNPTSYGSIIIYDNCIEISTIYRYSIIYQTQKIDWFQKFRKDIFNIIKQFEADEIIYLADNNNPLTCFLEGMVYENISYDAVKKAMITEFGQPVTDYKKLNTETFKYSNIKEFVLDNFNDLKV